LYMETLKILGKPPNSHGFIEPFSLPNMVITGKHHFCHKSSKLGAGLYHPQKLWLWGWFCDWLYHITTSQ
jgi:hypothetical protein